MREFEKHTREINAIDARPRPAIDVGAVLETNSLHGTPLWAALILASALIVDGFDLVLLGFIAPAVSADFSLSSAQMGFLLSFQQAGIAIGGVVGGLMGDRFGRRPTLLASVVVFALGGLLSPLAPTVSLFAIIRLFGGLGLGAISPNVATYLMEILPIKWRAQLTTLAYTSLALGATACAILAKLMLPHIAWTTLVIIGGLLPIPLIPLIVLLVPESPRFMVTRRCSSADIGKNLNRLVGGPIYSAADEFTQDVANRQAGRLRDLFARGLGRDTLCLWITILTLQFASSAILQMGTTLLTAIGLPLSQAFDSMLLFNFCGLIGAVATSTAIRYLGSKVTLAGLSSLAFLSLIVLTILSRTAHAAAGSLEAALGLLGFALMGVSLACFSLAAQVYPTAIRSTGTGAAVSAGRFMSIASSTIIGAVVVGAGPPSVFAGMALTVAITISALLLLKRHIAPQTRQTLNT